MDERIVIIGAGQAAAQAVVTLRAEGFAGHLVVVGDEAYPPYQRPPLSKAYLAGEFERERLFLKPEGYYAGTDCDLRLNARAMSIDRSRRTVRLSDGQDIAYDKLLLATGTRVRRLGIPGSGLAGIHYLRDIADVDALRPHITAGARLVVVGGGYIGLEVAAVAVKRGLDVRVLEAQSRLMQRAVSPPISVFYESVHRAAGVKLHLNTQVEAFEGEGTCRAVRAGGTSYPADVVLVGVGVVANEELARAAGLACDDGVIVNEFAETSDPAVFAAGDCTRHIGRDGHPIRLESVQNAIDQAKHAALAMLGRHTPYREVPWFWSDQYDLKLQIAGLAWPEDRIVLRGDPAARKFAVFHLRQGRVAAVEAVNAPPDYLVGRKLIADGAAVAPERLADTTIPMKNIV
jgi:3-phenylpropionate/trans-cinnamate dioxygenase ferredoxin reductase subunit